MIEVCQASYKKKSLAPRVAHPVLLKPAEIDTPVIVTLYYVTRKIHGGVNRPKWNLPARSQHL